MLSGYKTYITGIVMILFAVVVLGFSQGNWNEAVSMILAALAVMGLRSGIKNDIRES
jgi:hypothetical protein